MGRSLARLALVAVVSVAGCRSAAPPPSTVELTAAIARLQRPLPGELSALYRLRVPASGGLRLAILATAEGGRISVNEPFGSALSLAAWGRDGASRLYDLRQGCRAATADLESVLQVGHLPLPQAVRLLAGRLPSGPGDAVEIAGPWQLRVGGAGWACRVTLSAEPWRVTRVEEQASGTGGGWWAALEDHSGSVPGKIHLEHPKGRWAELELVRLQWDTVGELPRLPELPPCSEQGLDS